MALQIALDSVGVLRDEAAVWHFAHHLLRRPSRTQWEWLQRLSTQEAWRRLAAAFMPDGVPRTLPLPRTHAQFEEEYITCFEVGAPQPLCPLNESHWNKELPVSRVLFHNQLFFRQFGLRLSSAANEMADHLRHQLAFLDYLCHFEAQRRAENKPAQAEQAARARDDFVALHLRTWLPQAAAALNDRAPNSWAAHWLTLVASLVR